MMTTNICKVVGCGGRHEAKGFCCAHYNRFKKHGDPLGGKTARSAATAWFESHKNYTGDECLIWPFGTTDGRGIVWRAGKSWLVSRLMCEHRHGPPPSHKHEAAHSCGKGHTGCISPQHLDWKTRTENSADMVVHGTVVVGSRHKMAKLTEADVIAIRASTGVLQRELAIQFGVSQPLISLLKRGAGWSHIQC